MTFLAGQIGLIPAEMELPAAALQSVLSLQHIFRAARAVKVDPLRGIRGAVAYMTKEWTVGLVAETWRRAFDEVPPLAIVVVSGLPRGARVEWHVIRCQKTSDEETTGGFRMIFNDDRISTAVADVRGKDGVLCMRFGSSLPDTLRKANMAVQEIPCRGVYAAGERISKHASCTIIQTG